MRIVTAVAIVVLLGVTSIPAYAQRFEIRPVETVTLTTQQVLTGDKAGKSATVAGELRIPKGGTDPMPAVLLVHGASGIIPASSQLRAAANKSGKVRRSSSRKSSAKCCA